MENQRTKKKIFTVKKLAFSGIMVAMSIVLGKLLAFNIGNMIRFSLENMPLIFSGIVLGPIWGMLTGVVADLIGCLIVGYEINPIVTLGAAVIGALGGVVYKITPYVPSNIRILLTVTIPHLLGSIAIKTVGLAQFYLADSDMSYMALLGYRALTYLLIGTLEILIISFLMKNKGIKGYIAKYEK